MHIVKKFDTKVNNKKSSHKIKIIGRLKAIK